MVFESVKCTRCQGTGEYSFCQDYGTRCFRCGGTKVTLTKRGEAARAYYNKLCTIKVTELQPGMKIEGMGVTNNGRTFSYLGEVTDVPQLIESIGACSTVENGVTKVERWTHRIQVKTYSPKYGVSGIISSPDAMVKVYNLPNRAELVERALAYQATLTKQGMVQKAK